MLRKRLFDLGVCLLTAPVWLPVIGFIALVLLVAEGRPVFYVSSRRVCGRGSMRLWKFRTMVRNAASIANRDTIPVGDGPRFLNLAIESDLYTRVGRLIERCSLTELPQLFHVISGKMSLVGNRPLPENVVDSLLESYPDAEERFRVKCGLTGPVQLVGRTSLSDGERLLVENRYCHRVINGYSILLDSYILVSSVLLGLRLKGAMSAEAVLRRLSLPAKELFEPVHRFGWPVEPEGEAEAL